VKEITTERIKLVKAWSFGFSYKIFEDGSAWMRLKHAPAVAYREYTFNNIDHGMIVVSTLVRNWLYSFTLEIEDEKRG